MLQGLNNAIIIWIVRRGSRTLGELGRAGANGCLFGFRFFVCLFLQNGRELLGDALLRLPAAVTHVANRALELRGPKFRAHSCAPGRTLNEEAAHPCMDQKVYQEQQQRVLLTTRKELTWTFARTQTQSKPIQSTLPTSS